MIIIENIVVEKNILDAKFVCDLEKCKGGCCTLEGAGGAPIEKNEISKIRNSLKFVKKHLSEKNLEILEKKNFYYELDEKYAIESVDDKDCVFSFKENEIIKCAFEVSFFNNETKFRKPISCHLFPIRVKNFDGPILRYEKIPECNDAIKLGEKKSTLLIDFLETPIQNKFGKKFFQSLKNHSDKEK